MVTNVGDSIANVAVGAAAGQVGGTAKTDIGTDFASFMKDAVREAVDTMHEGEKMSIKGIAGQAELTDVVAAVADAELTLQTVVALRDRMVQAYQEIIRMPI
jgi:flagellar hook-basal body complex protein FliE